MPDPDQSAAPASSPPQAGNDSPPAKRPSRPRRRTVRKSADDAATPEQTKASPAAADGSDASPDKAPPKRRRRPRKNADKKSRSDAPEGRSRDNGEAPSSDNSDNADGDDDGKQRGRRRRNQRGRRRNFRRGPAPKHLVAECDFENAPPDVTMRFYKVEEGQRDALQMQDLYEVATQIRDGNDDTWTNCDKTILETIWERLSMTSTLRDNLAQMRVPRVVFDDWAEYWKGLTGRLIERQTRAPYRNRTERARLEIELNYQGAKTRMRAIVCTSAGNVPYHKAMATRISGTNKVKVRRRLFTWTPPVEDAVLQQLFGTGDAHVPSKQLVENLPSILNNRLDLLAGKSIDKRAGDGPAELRIDRIDGRVILMPKIGPAPVPPGDKTQVTRIRLKSGKFIVTTFQSPHLNAIRRLLKTMEAEPSPNCTYAVPDHPAAVSALRFHLKNLPRGVRVIPTPAVKSALDASSRIETILSVRPGDGWVDIDVSCSIDGELIDSADLQNAVSEGRNVVRNRGGNWLTIPDDAFDAFRGMVDDGDLEFGSSRVNNATAHRALRRLDPGMFQVSRSSEPLVEIIRAQPEVDPVTYSDHLNTILRPYQRDGVEFIHNRISYEAGCILADDMGLGKTLQVLACVDSQYARAERPAASLVVCPASVVSVWLREMERHTPALRAKALVGSPSQRQEMIDDFAETDVYVCTYAVVRNDLAAFQRNKFHMVILDEAQQIKNPDAQITLACNALNCRHRIAVTGTPLENRILDLWSIMEFLNPKLLGGRDDAIAALPETRRRFSRRLAPLMLRRTKEQVAPELPPRTEELITLPMTKAQSEIYGRELGKAKAALRQKGLVAVLAAITRLRQACCHPALLTDDPVANAEIADSAKLECLLEQIEEIVSEGHSVLVFSQFTRMLAIIQKHLVASKINHFILTGETPVKKRGELVESFNNSADPGVFLLSLRAAGTGLTLTRADYVFIFDPWWNPAVEAQAIDRAHRIGQEKPVFAYRLVTENTVEAKVIAMQDEKRELFAEVVEGAVTTESRLTADDLAALLEF